MRRVFALALFMILLNAPVSSAEVEEKADDGLIPGEFSGNARIVSDYVFRGVSQTVEESAAIQGGFDWSHESGLYAGTWGSSVDFGGDAYFENDIYVGFAPSFGGFVFDLSAWYFLYAADSDLNYWEFAAGVSREVAEGLGLSMGLIVSPDYFNAFGTGVVVNLGGSYQIPLDCVVAVSVNGLIEYTNTKDDGLVGSDGDYFDWNAGVVLTYDIMNVDLRYHGTDEANGLSDHRFVGGVGVVFP